MIVCVPVAVIVAMQASAQQPPPRIVSARLSQRGVDLVLRLRTDAVHPLRDGVLLCARRLSTTERPVADVCVRRSRGSRPLLELRRLAPDSAAVSKRRLRGSIHVGKSSVSATFRAGDAGMRTGKLRWQALSVRAGQRCAASARCESRLPANGYFTFELRRVAGCAASGRSFRRTGPGRDRRVALTFDDGPSSVTPSVLNVLDRMHVRATFFIVGVHVRGHTRLFRHMLAHGNAIGNHSLAHDLRPGAADLKRTSALINRATGYEPCLFRAPYGDLGGGAIGNARKLGMLTIGWNDDPSDWASPGASAIAARVLNQAKPGSIVLMHDGGGPRGQTAAALPTIVAGLRRRGYDSVTVPELLRLAPRYR
ncbi:MAG: polysaccharide deacetylase family protein [Solirubrobacterales bacterium]